jgi:arthrofactin-type cyclic lipopeptide synthetase C
MTLLAGWATLLSRLAGQEEVVIGAPVANRTRAEVEPLIGFFVNTLALRLDLSNGPTVSEFLRRVKTQSLAAQEHQDLPFEQVVEIARPPRSMAYSPLFQVMFGWENNEGGALELPGLTLLPVGMPYEGAKHDLSLYLSEVGDRIVGGLVYATALFDRSTIERYCLYLHNALRAMVSDDQEVIDRLALLSQTERRQMLVEWNATKSEYPSDQRVHELFEWQVARHPDAVALAYKESQLSYGELNVRANRLSRRLRELGVQPDTCVALCVERSLDMVVGLLAILKAGGAYVPLDPAYPIERLTYMLEDSAAMAALTHAQVEREIRSTLAGTGVPVIDLEADAGGWESESDANPDRASVGLSSEHLAYVIYTSGSTGRPKGAMIPHRGICNRLFWMQERYSLTCSDAVLQKTPFSFDVSVWEFFWPLMSGARLVMAKPGGHQDRDYLIEEIDGPFCAVDAPGVSRRRRTRSAPRLEPSLQQRGGPAARTGREVLQTTRRGITQSVWADRGVGGRDLLAV